MFSSGETHIWREDELKIDNGKYDGLIEAFYSGGKLKVSDFYLNTASGKASGKDSGLWFNYQGRPHKYSSKNIYYCECFHIKHLVKSFFFVTKDKILCYEESHPTYLAPPSDPVLDEAPKRSSKRKI